MIQDLIDNHFLVVRKFITQKKAKNLSKEFKDYCSKNNPDGDSQVPDTPAKYNYRSFLELLCEKTPEVSNLIGETVLPTYCYSRVYKNADFLEKHTDRDACEISLTVHLEGDKEWEIYVQSPDGKEVPIHLKCGDALLYLGCDAPHWRNSFCGEYYTQVFLHYVRSKESKSYTYFDKVKEKSNSSNQLNSSSKLESFIQIYENFIPEDLCNLIISHYETDENWKDSSIGEGTVDKKVRNCKVISISTDQIISKNYSIRKEIDEKLFGIVSNLILDLKEKYNTIAISQDSGYDLLKYSEGGFYSQHTDSFTNTPRAISCSLCLNDDYEGGEFAFFDRELTYKLKKGSAITFPSNFMYPHEILPVTKGTRYSIITWFI